MDMFDYEEMVKDVLRGVVREALAYTAENGLPGAHHLDISFRPDRLSWCGDPRLSSRASP